MLRLTILFVAVASAAMAQLESNSIAVSVSRQLYAAADQVSLRLSLSTDLNSSLEETVANLKAQGFSELILQNVYSDEKLHWTFGATVPLDGVGSLVALAYKVAVNISISGLDLSDKARVQTQCPYSELVSEAQTQARTVSNAAGLRTGRILSIIDGPSDIGLNTGSVAFLDISDFLLGSSYQVGQTPTQTCSLTATFQLLTN